MAAGWRTRAIAGGLMLGAVAAGFLVGGFLGDGSLRHWLLAYSGAFEFFGILLIAAPELVPLLHAAGTLAAQGWRNTKAQGTRLVDAIRRRLGRPRHQSVSVTAGGGATMTGGAKVRVSVREDAILEEKVAYLLHRDEVVQERLEDIGIRLKELPGQWKADIHIASAALRSEHADALEELRDQHMTVRLLGVLLVALGVVLATWGNLA